MGYHRGSEITQPTDVEAAKKWKVKARKVMYALTIIIDDEFLQRIKNVKTPKEAWATLAMIFTKKNDAEFKGILTAIRGWATEPTLYELENLLANEEDLEKPLSSLTIKD
ncbi:hypothetical protein H5410_045032 [Solanum commersonii]|uniref:Uncharacterized protein n=1 Tax=Solanum commersonii TaxID=4109 RepID=A0A9J5XBG7_SOLCO|nr:hypothetical protein H5410_045032 [Solanum commersonii]